MQAGYDSSFLQALLEPVVQQAIRLVIAMSEFVLHRLLTHSKCLLLLLVEGIAKLSFIASRCIKVLLESSDLGLFLTTQPFCSWSI